MKDRGKQHYYKFISWVFLTLSGLLFIFLLTSSSIAVFALPLFFITFVLGIYFFIEGKKVEYIPETLSKGEKLAKAAVAAQVGLPPFP